MEIRSKNAYLVAKTGKTKWRPQIITLAWHAAFLLVVGNLLVQGCSACIKPTGYVELFFATILRRYPPEYTGSTFCKLITTYVERSYNCPLTWVSGPVLGKNFILLYSSLGGEAREQWFGMKRQIRHE